jgi:two-component system response regulator GlrR
MRLLGVTVLLVEDDVDNLEPLASFLDGEGARTFGAGSISSALSLTEGENIDLLVSDLELPDGDGGALLATLRQRDGRSDVPAIAVSSYSDPQWRTKAADFGFARYAVKPYSRQCLVDWIVELSARAEKRASA